MSGRLREDRRLAATLLEGRAQDVVVRQPADFADWDDAVFFAENHDRAFILMVTDDVAWGPVSSYVQEPDEYRGKPVLNVDVANSLRGVEQRIVDIFDGWFDRKDPPQ